MAFFVASEPTSDAQLRQNLDKTKSIPRKRIRVIEMGPPKTSIEVQRHVVHVLTKAAT